MFERLGSRGSASATAVVIAGLLAAFGFRIFFGLHAPPSIIADDEIQVYLVGLKSYVTRTWPYFGPDVSVGANMYAGQIAGALQGLLIALPLYVWPAPMSPFVFVNLLTFLALTFLGWYTCRRLPGFPRWFVFIWLYIAPWNTYFSTTVINPSYALVGAVLFFIGFLESIPALRAGLISVRWANVMLAFGLFWVAQLHMSWVMLGLVATFSVYAQWKAGRLGTALLFGALGALPMLALLVPTYLVYGFSTGQDLAATSRLDPRGVRDVFVVLGRFLSFASFELPRFLGAGTQARVDYLLQTPWLAAPGFLLWGIGLIQPLMLVAIWFVRNHPRGDWRGIKFTTLGLFLLVYFLFWFSGRSPLSYRFVSTLPLVMLYSFYCWDYLSASRTWRVLGVVFLATSVVFQVGNAWKSARAGVSVYAQCKERIERAIQQKDYRLLAERRPTARY